MRKYLFPVAVLAVLGAAGVVDASVPYDEPPPITVDPEPVPPTFPTNDLVCIDMGIEDREVAPDVFVQDIYFDCGNFTMTVILSADTIRQLNQEDTS